MTLGWPELALIVSGTVVLSLAGYRIWMVIAGWLADRRWHKQGIDRRDGKKGRRKDD